MSGLASAAVRGSLWLGAVNLLSKGSQVAVTLSLAAFLGEAELGLVTLVVALVNVGQVIQAMGVYDVISRTDRDPAVMAGTVLTLSVGTGLALAALLVLAAPALAGLLGSPEAAPLIRLAACALPFTAAGGVQMGLMHRDLAFRRRMLPDAGGAILGACVTVVLAANGSGPYAMVVGLLVTAVAQPLLGIMVGAWVGPRWDTDAAAEAVRWIAVVGPAAIVATLLVNVDYPVIGHVLGPEAVGVYSLAYRIAWMPYIMGAIVLGAVAFPVYTRLIREGRDADLPTAISRFTRATALVTGCLYVTAAVLGARVVVLGERWAPAAPVLALLCVYGLAISVTHIWYEAIRAAGHPRRYLALQTAHLVALVLALIGVTRFGVVAVAAAQAVVALVMAAVAWRTLARFGLAPARMSMSLLGTWALAAAPVVVLDRLGVFGPPDSVLGAPAAGLAAIACCACSVLLTQRAALADLRSGGQR